jgi:hypothetical protein
VGGAAAFFDGADLVSALLESREDGLAGAFLQVGRFA